MSLTQNLGFLRLSLVPTAAVTFVTFGDEVWSPQIHHPKFVPRAFPPIPTFRGKLVAFYKMGFSQV